MASVQSVQVGRCEEPECVCPGDHGSALVRGVETMMKWMTCVYRQAGCPVCRSTTRYESAVPRHLREVFFEVQGGSDVLGGPGWERT